MIGKSSDCYNKIPESIRPKVDKLIQTHKPDATPNRLVSECDQLFGGGKLTDCIVRKWKHAKGITIY